MTRPPMFSETKEGISKVIAWARETGSTLTPWHRDLAESKGVATDGVNFAELAR